MTDGWRTPDRPLIDLLPDPRPAKRRRVTGSRRRRYVAGNRPSRKVAPAPPQQRKTRPWAWWSLGVIGALALATRVAGAMQG
ncbi:hypothetical protein [Cellulomonas sp.]|uniref:hypothetical protein n=1 Tax=Cellulomonas sp. TaxID=40001 RepID=UPI002D3222CB|nr:hypothetical protein [Cellulomonas sp.]HYQ76182.1 hypothetical protein [Cellulomonas sp.]